MNDHCISLLASVILLADSQEKKKDRLNGLSQLKHIHVIFAKKLIFTNVSQKSQLGSPNATLCFLWKFQISIHCKWFVLMLRENVKNMPIYDQTYRHSIGLLYILQTCTCILRLLLFVWCRRCYFSIDLLII